MISGFSPYSNSSLGIASAAASPQSEQNSGHHPFMAQSRTMPNCYNIFFSKVYDHYHAQLQQFIIEELRKNPLLNTPHCQSKNNFYLTGLAFLKKIFEFPVNGGAGEKQKFHKTMTIVLRNLIAEIDNAEEEGIIFAEFLENFCYWLYTNSRLTSSTKAFLESKLPERFNQLPFFSLSEQFELFHSALNAHVTINNSISDYHLDLLKDGDVPSQLMTVRNGSRETIFIRTHMPKTKRNKRLPEFELFLSTLKKRGQSFLYVNHAERSERFKHTVEDLDDGAHLLVISLPKNGPLYDQEDQGLYDAASFKRFCLDYLLNETISYQPKSVDNNLWRALISEAIREVHTYHFSDTSTLQQNERKEFIDLLYSKIIQKLVFTKQPDFAALCCEYSIDRGASMFGLLHTDLCFQNQSTLDLNALVQIYAQSVLVRNRAMEIKYHGRLVAAVRRLENSGNIPPLLSIIQNNRESL